MQANVWNVCITDRSFLIAVVSVQSQEGVGSDGTLRCRKQVVNGKLGGGKLLQVVLLLLLLHYLIKQGLLLLLHHTNTCTSAPYHETIKKSSFARILINKNLV